jgi:hypothetical protein
VNVTINVRNIQAVMTDTICVQNIVPKMVAEFGYIFHRIKGAITLNYYKKLF